MVEAVRLSDINFVAGPTRGVQDNSNMAALNLFENTAKTVGAVYGAHVKSNLSNEINQANSAFAKEQALSKSVRDGLKTTLQEEISKGSVLVDDPIIQDLRTDITKLNSFLNAGGNADIYAAKIENATRKAMRRAPWLADELRKTTDKTKTGAGKSLIQQEQDLALALRTQQVTSLQRNMANAGLQFNDPLGEIKLQQHNMNKAEAANILNQSTLLKSDVARVQTVLSANATESMTSMLRTIESEYGSITNAPQAVREQAVQQLELMQASLRSDLAGVMSDQFGPRSGLIDRARLDTDADIIGDQISKYIDVLQGKSKAEGLALDTSRLENEALHDLGRDSPALLNQVLLLRSVPSLGASITGTDMQRRLDILLSRHLKDLGKPGDAFNLDSINLTANLEPEDAEFLQRNTSLSVNELVRTQLRDGTKEQKDISAKSYSDVVKGLAEHGPDQYKAPSYDEAIKTLSSSDFKRHQELFKDEELTADVGTMLTDYTDSKLIPSINKRLESYPEITPVLTNAGLSFEVKAQGTTSRNTAARREAKRLNQAWGVRSKNLLKATRNVSSMLGKELSDSEALAVHFTQFSALKGLKQPNTSTFNKAKEGATSVLDSLGLGNIVDIFSDEE